MIGTADELAAQGIAVPRPTAPTPGRAARRCSAWSTRSGRFRDDVNPMFYRALAVSMTLLLGSTVLLRFAYQHRRG